VDFFAKICKVVTDLLGSVFTSRKQVLSKIYATTFKNDKHADFFEQLVDRKTSNGLILS